MLSPLNIEIKIKTTHKNYEQDYSAAVGCDPLIKTIKGKTWTLDEQDYKDSITK